MAGDAILATAILGGMCLLMWFLARLAKKRMGIGSGVVANDALRVVGKRPLDQKNAMWVVEIAGGRYILLGTSADGGVTKLDDISAEEYGAMVDQEAQAAAARRPKLRIAAPGRPGDAATTTAAVSTDADAEAEADADAEEQRFATVAESFNHFLTKAKDARANRKASGE